LSPTAQKIHCVCVCVYLSVVCESGCWNGGECIAVNGEAKCICPSSWTGSRCQDGLLIPFCFTYIYFTFIYI